MYIYRLSNWFKIVADISHKDLLESLGNTAAGFTKNLANQVANFACDLYKQYPWALTFGDTGNYSKGVWDELCGERPSGLPAPPTLPFTGGQCVGVQYRINMEAAYAEGSPPRLKVDRYPQFFSGPIVGVRTIKKPVSSDRSSYEFFLQVGNPVQEIRQTETQWGSFEASYGIPEPYVRVVSVSRTDGQPDNCGNLPIDYPQTPVPPAARTTSVEVNVHGNTYNVPITFKGVNNYNIELDAGDISFSFDLVGVNINSNNQVIANIEDNVLTLNENVSNLTQVAIPFINNSVNFNSSFNFGNFQTEEDGGSSSPADEEQSDNIAYVTLDITRKPVNAKTQEGELAQDLVYAGWFQFAAKGYYFPREPIHFSKAIFKAPFGATDYAYTLYEGFEAKVVVHRV